MTVDIKTKTVLLVTEHIASSVVLFAVQLCPNLKTLQKRRLLFLYKCESKMPPMKLQNNNNSNVSRESGGVGGSGGGDISDGDVSNGESEHSNSSRENRDSSDEEPDSDDSSEMEEGECETRRTQLFEHVQDLEGQFSMLREQLYRERISQVTF